jgi:hypothetical protein
MAAGTSFRVMRGKGFRRNPIISQHYLTSGSLGPPHSEAVSLSVPNPLLSVPNPGLTIKTRPKNQKNAKKHTSKRVFGVFLTLTSVFGAKFTIFLVKCRLKSLNLGCN